MIANSDLSARAAREMSTALMSCDLRAEIALSHSHVVLVFLVLIIKKKIVTGHAACIVL